MASRTAPRDGTTPKRPYIVGVGGTAVPDSSVERVLRYTLELAAAQGAQTELFDGLRIHLPHYSRPKEGMKRTGRVRRYVEALRRADGIILATPCYHGGPSGLLKNALDYAEDLSQDMRPYFDGRAVGIIVCGYGWQSTAMALASLRNIVHALRGWSTPLGMALNMRQKISLDSGTLGEPAAVKQAKTMVTQVVAFSRHAL